MTAGGRLVQPLSAAIPITIFALAAVAIPLAAGERLGMGSERLGAWLLVLYAVPGVVSLLLTAVYRQPLLFAWHTGVVLFLASLAGDYSLAELRGATLVSGAVVVALGVSGLTTRIADLVPGPVVFAVVAASVLPFVIGVFDALGDERVIVGVVLLVWVASRALLGARVPPILPALVAGLVVAAVAGRLEPLPGGWATVDLAPARPALSVAAAVTVAPVFVALVSLYSNLAAVTYLRSQEYDPPARVVEVASGVGTMIGSFVAPATVGMGSLVTPLTASPEAGDRDVRHRSVYAASSAFVVIGLAGTLAAGIPEAVPLEVLLAVAGLALVGVLSTAMEHVVEGPIRLGSVLAFAVALSDLSMFGLGAPFWALVVGTGVAWVLERDAMRPTAPPARPT